MRYLLVFYFYCATSLNFAHASVFSTDIKGTLAIAKKEKKPVIIDFFGIWCPPCNELDETVFEATSFLEKAKAFKLLKVDADAKSSWKIKDKYKVGGYPTIVFTDYLGNETYRIVGYRTLKEFTRIMDLVASAKAGGFEQACASNTEDDVWRCAVICSERKDLECSAQAFRKLESMLKPDSARFDWVRTYAIEAIETTDLKRMGYENLMQANPKTPQALIWGSSYLGLFDDEKTIKPKKALLESVLAHYPAMIKDPKLEELGLSFTDAIQIRAEILEKIGKMDEAKLAWKEAAQALAREADLLPKDTHARGFTLDRIGCLQQAGEREEALKLATEYQALFPKEFTFYFVAGNILENQKKFPEAIAVAKKALELSYGDNRIRVATLLLRLYATVPDKVSAKSIYDEVTQMIKPDAKLDVRTHRYLKKLKEAWEKIA